MIKNHWFWTFVSTVLIEFDHFWSNLTIFDFFKCWHPCQGTLFTLFVFSLLHNCMIPTWGLLLHFCHLLPFLLFSMLYSTGWREGDLPFTAFFTIDESERERREMVSLPSKSDLRSQPGCSSKSWLLAEVKNVFLPYRKLRLRDSTRLKFWQRRVVLVRNTSTIMIYFWK